MENNFIKIYKNIIPQEVCEYLIKTYEEMSHAHYKGRAGAYGSVKLEIKDSMDMNLLEVLDHKPGLKSLILGNIRKALDSSIVDYFKTYPYTQLTPFDKEYTDEQILQHIQSTYSFWSKSIVMKKYDKGKGGYHAFHEDCGNVSPSVERMLVCMFYLNDVKEGGETEFYHQNLKVPPTQGSLVIFPTYFTHLHKGHVPISNDKYIINIWLLKNNISYWRIWDNKQKNLQK